MCDISTTLDSAFVITLSIAAYMDLKSRKVANYLPSSLFLLAIFRMVMKQSVQASLGLIPAIVTAVLFYQEEYRIGGADIKCMAGIGIYLGLFSALESYIIAFVLAIILSVVKNRLTQNKEEVGIPLCVYLAIGSTITILLKT